MYLYMYMYSYIYIYIYMFISYVHVYSQFKVPEGQGKYSAMTVEVIKLEHDRFFFTFVEPLFQPLFF